MFDVICASVQVDQAQMGAPCPGVSCGPRPAMTGITKDGLPLIKCSISFACPGIRACDQACVRQGEMPAKKTTSRWCPFTGVWEGSELQSDMVATPSASTLCARAESAVEGETES